MWPSFIALTLLDALIGNQLPPSGDSQTLVGAALVAMFLNLMGVILLSRPVGMLVRRRRRDLPMLIARDYGGTLVLLAITALLVLAGLAHRPAIDANRSAMRDAIARAQAWIGDRAPDQFRRDVSLVSVYAIEPGSIYRACVPSSEGPRTYCVVVDTRRPFGRSVSFAGYEPNSLLSQGTG